ncbi:MAG: TolC family protein [Planctomycetota bacterium]|jgi:outer membrane protein TolC|nr:TolC family protein [Planctomycetota bacterium]
MTIQRNSLCAALLVSAACQSPAEHAAAADESVYALIEARRAALVGEAAPFEITPAPDSLRQRILRGEPAGMDGLGLVECLEIAAENSREVQTRRESLYLTALDLTLERWRLGWIGGVTGEAGADGTLGEGGEASGGVSPSLSRLLGTGAQIVAGIGLTAARSIGLGGEWTADSSLALSVTQPLMRGAGRRIVEEPLTQAERDLVYEVRSFERFRRTFAVDIAGSYYRLLQQQDAVANEEANIETVRQIRLRNEALADAGRLSAIQVDQASQDELRSANRLLDTRASLGLALDDFKLTLGLPIATDIGLDAAEFDGLREAGLGEIGVRVDDALAFALGHRLDFMTSLEQVADAGRRVELAADALRAGLDVSLSASSTSAPDRPGKHEADDVAWVASLGFDLPVDRLPERNAYRSQQIALEATRRAHEQLEDVIRVGLRDTLRSARSTREGHEINENAVALAERRVANAGMNLEAGRASTRDILEAQTALLEAQNAATRSLIDFTLARLALYRDMELLIVDEEGIDVDETLFEDWSETRR